MTLYLTAYRSSAEHEKHLKIVEMCRQCSVSLPRETAAYFGDDSDGVDPRELEDTDERLRVAFVQLSDGEDRPRGTLEATAINEEMIVGFEIAVDDLPKDAKRLRIVWHY